MSYNFYLSFNLGRIDNQIQLSVLVKFYAKQVSEKSKATKQRMIKDKNTGGFRPKYGYDVDENGYLAPCEKEQSVIRLMKILRKKGNFYKSICEKITKATCKKFLQSWMFNILKRESIIPLNKAQFHQIKRLLNTISAIWNFKKNL